MSILDTDLTLIIRRSSGTFPYYGRGLSKAEYRDRMPMRF